MNPGDTDEMAEGCGRLGCALCLQVCVGAEAEDQFHMVEIEGLTYDGKSTRVPLAVLRPSIMPSVSLRVREAALGRLC